MSLWVPSKKQVVPISVISTQFKFMQYTELIDRLLIFSLFSKYIQMNLSEVILEKLLPASLCHFDAYLQGKQKNTTNHQTATLQYMKRTGLLHQALRSRSDEADYLRSIVNSLFPYLLPSNCQESR